MDINPIGPSNYWVLTKKLIDPHLTQKQYTQIQPSPSHKKEKRKKKKPSLQSLRRFRFPTFSQQPNMEKYVAYIFVGFDFLGCAIDGLGDSVDSSVHPGQISISHISGDPCSKLSRNPLWNCAGIAAIKVMKMLRIQSVGFSLSLHKGLCLGSGLESSAASATTAAVAVNEIFGGKLGSEELVLARLKSEEKVSGYHDDNVGSAGNLRLYSVFGCLETVGK